jgi:hypothetical protein
MRDKRDPNRKRFIADQRFRLVFSQHEEHGCLGAEEQWKWLHDCVSLHSELDDETREQFWYAFGRASSGLTVSCQGLLFQLIWNAERVWERAPELARSMLLSFQNLEDVVVPEDRGVLAMFKRACPHLQELHNADELWLEYVLPGEVPLESTTRGETD